MPIGKLIASVLIAIHVLLSGCVVVPANDAASVNACELSTDKKVLRVVNVVEQTDSYYSVAGALLTPILVPTTALVSGLYVAVNNTYNLGEERIRCGD